MYGYLNARFGPKVATMLCGIWFAALIIAAGLCSFEAPAPFGYNGR